MSRYCGNHNPEQFFAAATHWRQVALVNDGSVFTDKPLWTEENFAELLREFVAKPDDSKDSFLEKLKRQLDAATANAKQLAAEIQWLLWLAASNVKATTKAEEVKEIWAWSGERLPASPWLQVEALEGVGSAGQGILLYRWRELAFIIRAVHLFKRLPLNEREQTLKEGWTLGAWLEQVPEFSQRQFRHMLLYMLFPDDFERVFSAGDRKSIMRRFTGKTASEVNSLSPSEVDRGLASIRAKCADTYPGVRLDFYNPPLEALWQEAERKV